MRCYVIKTDDGPQRIQADKPPSKESQKHLNALINAAKKKMKKPSSPKSELSE